MEAFVKYSLKEKKSNEELLKWCEKNKTLCINHKNIISKYILKNNGFNTENFKGDFNKIYKEMNDAGINKRKASLKIIPDYPSELKKFLQFNNIKEDKSKSSHFSFTDNSLSPTVKIGGKKKSVKKIVKK